MQIEIIEESSSSLVEYERVSIAFEARSRYNILTTNDGFQLLEKSISSFIKDYDAYERPTSLQALFDLSNWGFFAALAHGRRVGGAIAAWNTRGVEMLEECQDVVCLWDIRVHPDFRGFGIGRSLFAHVEKWGKERNCKLLKVETQDNNVPACRFYENLGCELRQVNENVYPKELNEKQLLWYKVLVSGG